MCESIKCLYVEPRYVKMQRKCAARIENCLTNQNGSVSCSGTQKMARFTLSLSQMGKLKLRRFLSGPRITQLRAESDLLKSRSAYFLQ